jgi:hypothetical protein
VAAVVDYVDNWGARLLGRLYVQFRNDPTWAIWCTQILGPQFDDLERAGQSLLLILSIDDVSGPVLDTIGRLVGQPRGGASDPVYRLRLKARIAANLSDSGATAIYRVFSFLLAGHSRRLTYSAIKSFALTIGGVITAADGAIGLDFLSAAKASSARAILEWQEQADALCFTTATATYCRAATIVGAATMQVDPRRVALLPPAGSVVIDGTLAATQEVAAYSSIVVSGPSALMTFTAPLTKAHAIGSELELVGDPGLGWGNAANPLIGGQFAWAGQAP